MRWEHLTHKDFKKAVKASKGVCALPLGVIEKHSEHLPLGIDIIKVHEMCCEAAEKEPVVVFPWYYFTQINEARHLAGTIAIKPDLMFDLLENVCDEIGRNGFKKIVLVNGHGGNNMFLPYFVQAMCSKRRPYTVYLPAGVYGALKDKIMRVLDTEENHAGEFETSILMASNPELVKMKDLPKKPGLPLNRAKHINGIMTPMFWYCDYPEHYAGDARRSTPEKGRKIMKLAVDYIADNFKRIKNDRITPKLLDEFAGKSERVGKNV
jgi:creatinine amidohydrolase